MRDSLHAAEADATERAFFLALIPEGPDAIERVLRRYIDLRDGRTEIPDEWQ